MSDLKLIAAAALAAVGSALATAGLLALLVGCSPALGIGLRRALEGKS